MWLFELVRRIEQAKDVSERTYLLRAVSETVLQEKTGGEYFEPVLPASLLQVQFQERRDAFLRSYLRPYGLFPQTLFTLVYEDGDGDVDPSLRKIADGFFLDVHPIFATEALATLLSQFSHSGRSQSHLWRLLNQALLEEFDQGMAVLWDVQKWSEIFPEKKWEECCERIVGWFVSMTETVSDEDMRDGFSAASLLPKVAEALMRGNVKDALHDVVHPNLTLLGSFLRRFLNRGSGLPLVEAIIDRCKIWLQEEDMEACLFPLVQSIGDAHATEKFFRQMLFLLPGRCEDDMAVALLRSFSMSPVGKEMEHGVYYTLFERLLMKEELPMRTVQCLISVLAGSEEKLQHVALCVGKMWADKMAIQHLPLPRQAYLTFLLQCLIPHLTVVFAEVGDARISRSLLEGVSNRLESCLETVRCQGMRVAHAISARQPNTEPLFSDLELDFQFLRKEEQWEEPSIQVSKAEAAPPSQEQEGDSDDESDFDSNVADDEPTEPQHTLDAPGTVFMAEHRPVTLLDIHQDLRKSEEPMEVIKALKRLTVLIQEHPAELPAIANELSRTLVFVPLPDWIHEELKKEDAFALKGLKSSSSVRVCCLSLLLTEAPMHCGDTVAMLICSKQVAEYQRLEILESMREASKKLSSSPGHLATDKHSELKMPEPSEKSRVWGVRSLTVEKGKGRTWRNRFVDVAGLWVSSLMLACQTVAHGFNLMERNPVVLGAVLVTLGTFADCASQSIVSTSLALTAFPIIRAVMEQKKENCYLRRCSLQAMTSLIKSVPVGRLSAALSGQPLVEVQDETEQAIGEMLLWTKSQGEHLLASDQDETCRHLAAHCLHVCAVASKAALELQQNHDPVKLTSKTVCYRIPERRDKLPMNKKVVTLFKERERS